MLVFGSSAMQLSTPDSDIDLTLYLPSRERLTRKLKARKLAREPVSFGHAETYFAGSLKRSVRGVTPPTRTVTLRLPVHDYCTQ